MQDPKITEAQSNDPRHQLLMAKVFSGGESVNHGIVDRYLTRSIALSLASIAESLQTIGERLDPPPRTTD